MNRKMRSARVKGFTLVEMVTVIAIIGILLGILTPAMMNYLRRSRVQAANANAKMIYNSVQTEVQKYINKDRVKEADADKSGFGDSIWLSYSILDGGSTRIRCATTVAPDVPAALSDITGPGTTFTIGTRQACADVVNNVNRNVSGAVEVNWAVYVEKYIVRGCVSADRLTSRYVGCYSSNKTMATDQESLSYDDCYLCVLGDKVAQYSS